LAKGKSTAKKLTTPSLAAGRDIEPEAAPGADGYIFQGELLTQVNRALWLPAGLGEDEKFKRIKSALLMLARIKPRDEIEGLLAAQMVVTHSAVMDCFRRAMLNEQSFEGRDLNLKHAAKLMSIYTRQLEVLDKHRGKGQQKVTVEYVNVEAGGQAIVGNVEMGKRKRRKGPATPAIDHSPEEPLEIPDPVASQRTPQKVRRGR